MKRLLLSLALASSLLPLTARAQVEMSISVGLPVAPPLVVVQPGVQVVENYPEEVFFVGGWYWCRRGPYWYRAPSPRASFAYVEPGYVPTRLAYMPPPGHYKHWRREQLREDHRWWKEHEHDRRRAWAEHERERRNFDHERRKEFREHEKAERHAWKERGPSGRPAPAPAAHEFHGGQAPRPAPHVGPASGPAPRGQHGHGDEGHGHGHHD